MNLTYIKETASQAKGNGVKTRMSNEINPFDRSFESLEALADTISEVLGCAITIEDANHRLIAYSTHEAQTDPVRIATIVGRRVPEKVIASLWREGFIQQLMKSEDPVPIKALDDVKLGRRIAISIRNNREVLGYIWVLEDARQLEEADFLQLKHASRAAKTKLLQLQLQKRKEQEGFEDFFWQLLTGHISSGDAVRQKSDKLGIPLMDCFQVMVVEFDSDISEQRAQQIRYLISTTQRIRIALHIVDRTQLVLLGTSSSRNQFAADSSEFLRLFAQQMKDRFGVSPGQTAIGNIYEDYGLVEKSYREALSVLQVKRQFPQETKRFVHYRDLGFYRFLPLMAEENRIHAHTNPSLLKLRQYDREHNGNLLHTLEIFLLQDSNVKDAADALHVHTNTLNYRLKRISEIGNIDLKDMDQKVSLYLDLKSEKL